MKRNNMLKVAGTAEVIRSHQKDDNILHRLRSSTADIAQSLFGPRIWIKWRQQLDLAANAAYFLLTTVSDLQTVGEEYVNIIQTDHTLRQLPSKWRRGVMVALHICAPYILQTTLQRFEHQLQTSGSLPIKPSTRKILLDVLPYLRKGVALMHRLHLTTFYIQGFFYHLAKRVTGIRYIQISNGDNNQNQPFKILGYLSFLQISLSVVIHLYQIVIALKEKKGRGDLMEYGGELCSQDRLMVQPKDKCPLCLGKRLTTTLTPCGHLYCWHCILEWCQAKQECPLCRDHFNPQQLIVLQNYDTS